MQFLSFAYESFFHLADAVCNTIQTVINLPNDMIFLQMPGSFPEGTGPTPVFELALKLFFQYIL